MLELTNQPIDVQAVRHSVESPDAGAVVVFLGTTRQTTNGRQTKYLEYECYNPMAQAKLTELAEQASTRWSLVGCSIVHRFGRLDIGEISVAIAVSATHREPAFEAARWLIDRIKQVVPIWKKEHWADGTSQWIHPGLEVPHMKEGGIDP
jgi:molybdopterin synthase catalytic subunit